MGANVVDCSCKIVGLVGGDVFEEKPGWRLSKSV